MTVEMVLLPLFVQVALTFIVLFTLAGRRFGAVRRGELRGPVALREPNWPDRVRQAEYNYQNQFELPVLFYVLTIAVIITKKADLLFVAMAWVFVLLRALHAGVHLTTNTLAVRGPTFIVAALVLFAMWVIFFIRLMLFP
ncbi:MAG: MAPEG family protein [Pseudorhodoplanes sp.]